MSTTKPNFFIVGAPKCGTTAMDDYLAQHPEICMAKKEQHFFGSDLGYRIERTTEEDYKNSFSSSGDKKIKGESSVWYLYSKTAAQEIKNFSPDAKILIMLRNPVEMVYSLHSQNIYDCNEDVLVFEEALALEEKRKKGQLLPIGCTFKDCLLYTEAGMYYEQTKRYLETFGKNNVMIMLYDDFKKNTAKEYKNVLYFLGVNENFNPQLDIINANKTLKNLSLHKLIKSPTERQRKIFRALFPFKTIRARAMDFIQKKNTANEKRKTMNESTRRKLIEIFKEDVNKLSKLIEKNLSDWQQ